MPFRAVLFATLLLLTLAPCRAEKTLRRPPGTTRYAAMVAQLKTLAARSGGRLSLASIGTSVKGRALWLATVQMPAAGASQAHNPGNELPVWGAFGQSSCGRVLPARGLSCGRKKEHPFLLRPARAVGVYAPQTGNSLPGHLPGGGCAAARRRNNPDPPLLGAGGPPRRTILYICRLHGHEPASTEGALAFLKQLVDAPPGSPLYETLSHVTVYVVPMANPDGSEAFRRQNAHGQDINRDWRTRTQPETQALYKTILRVKPDILTDQHELYPDDPRPDFTEAVSFGSGAPDKVAVFCDDSQSVVGAWMAAQGVPIVNHWVDDTRPARLTHRFGGVILGIPTLLFETNRLAGTGRSVEIRAHAHTLFMTAVLHLAAGERDQMLSDAAAHGFLPQPKPNALLVPIDPEAAP